MLNPWQLCVNDAIDSSLCSLVYTSVADHKVALKLSIGSLLTKVDIKSTYRLIPVHPLDRHMLGMEWEGKTDVDGSYASCSVCAPRQESLMQWLIL